MKVKFSVSYEFLTRAPATYKGTVDAGAEATCMARAVRKAKKALEPRGWVSVICVLDRPEEEEVLAGTKRRPKEDTALGRAPAMAGENSRGIL